MNQTKLFYHTYILQNYYFIASIDLNLTHYQNKTKLQTKSCTDFVILFWTLKNKRYVDCTLANFLDKIEFGNKVNNNCKQKKQKKKKKVNYKEINDNKHI